MKFNKYNIQIIALIISALGLMVTMLSFTRDNLLIHYDSTDVLTLATALVGLTTTIYFGVAIKRKNPKKYIYLSYASMDKVVAEKISSELSKQFKVLSKYRFEIVTADSIPLGSDMNIAMKENIFKADTIIIIVSSSYLQNEWCQKEFTAISNENKRIIPIVTESFSNLERLPKDISNVKSLSLINCESDKDFSNTISILAKDLIKQRKD